MRSEQTGQSVYILNTSSEAFRDGFGGGTMDRNPCPRLRVWEGEGRSWSQAKGAELLGKIRNFDVMMSKKNAGIRSNY